MPPPANSSSSSSSGGKITASAGFGFARPMPPSVAGVSSGWLVRLRADPEPVADLIQQFLPLLAAAVFKADSLSHCLGAFLGNANG